jgi:hypothetical protein
MIHDLLRCRGELANARVLDLTDGDEVLTSWFTTGTMLRGFSHVSTLLTHPHGVSVAATSSRAVKDVAVSRSDGRSEAGRFFLGSSSDPTSGRRRQMSRRSARGTGSS